MRPVKVVPSVISSCIYVEGKAAVIAGLKTHAFSECIRGGGRKTVGEFPVKFQLQSVIAGGVSREEQVGVGGPAEGIKLRKAVISKTGHSSRVKVVVHDRTHAVIANVRHFEDKFPRQRLLYRPVP